MASSPTLGADGPIGLIIKVEGSAIPDTLQVVSVRTRAEAGRWPEAVIVLATGSIAENEFDVSDGATFKFGNAITIAGFYGDDSDTKIFAGLITATRMRISSRRGPMLEVKARASAAKMGRVRASALYQQKKDSDIISAVLSDAGMTAQVTATQDEAADQIRHDCTDWDYLRVLSDRNGHVVLVDDKTVSSKPPDTSAAAALTVTLGVDMLEFDASVNTTETIKDAEGRSWKPASQETVTGTSGAAPANDWGSTPASDAAAALGDRTHTFDTPRSLEASRLKTIADARVLRSVLSGITGTCAFQGSGKIKPGDMLEIKGVGDRYGGKAYVSGVEHEIEDGAWTTTAILGLKDHWLADEDGIAGPRAAAITPPINGVHVATVLQIHEDPDSQQRIKVSLPLIGENGAEVWARYAQPYASKDAGIQFMPEVDDEVLVAFLNDDPDAPVVIGSLHNTVANQPNPPDEENKIKGIVTRSNLKISFDDDKMITVIETPGGNKITLDDESETVVVEDLTGNKMEMTTDGITLDSPGDIAIKAGGKIDIEAGGDATVKGTNVTCDAGAQGTFKGGAGAELSSGGTTKVAGPTVMIN